MGVYLDKYGRYRVKQLLLVLLLAASAASAPAQDQPIITVLDLAMDGVSEMEMRSVIALLSSALFDTGQYTVIDVAERETVLKEIEFSVSDCTDESCQLEIGRMLSAEYIVMGSIGKVGTKIVLATKMLETATTKTVSTAEGTYKSVDALVRDIDNIALVLAGLKKKQLISRSQWRTVRKVSFPTVGGLACAGGVVLAIGAARYYTDTVEPRFVDYDTAPPASDFDALYDAYRSVYVRYLIRLISGGGLVLGGGTLIGLAVPLFIQDWRRPEPQVVSVLPMLRPETCGLVVRISY